MDPAHIVRELCNLTDNGLREYFNLAVGAGDSAQLTRVQDEWCSRLSTMRDNVETQQLRARAAQGTVKDLKEVVNAVTESFSVSALQAA